MNYPALKEKQVRLLAVLWLLRRAMEEKNEVVTGLAVRSSGKVGNHFELESLDGTRWRVSVVEVRRRKPSKGGS